MNTFISRLKDDCLNPNKKRGSNDRVAVSTKDLQELIHHFETLDNEARNNYKVLWLTPDAKKA